MEPLAKFGSEYSPVVVRLRTYKGTRLLDIRKYYTKKKELMPSPKGICLTTSNFTDVCDLLTENKKDISDWLEQGGDEVQDQVENQMLLRSESAERAIRKKRKLESGTELFRDGKIAEYSAKGGVDNLKLNKKHSFISSVSDIVESIQQTPQGEAAELLQLYLSQLIVSYYRAISRFDDEKKYSVAELTSLIENEWGIILENYFVESGD